MASKPKTRPKRVSTPEVTCDVEARKSIWEFYSNFGAPRIQKIAREVLAEMERANVRKTP